MYISGDINTFEKRMHQFVTGTNDLELYKLEGSLYTGDAPKHEKNRWNKEYIKKGVILNFPTGAVFI